MTCDYRTAQLFPQCIQGKHPVFFEVHIALLIHPSILQGTTGDVYNIFGVYTGDSLSSQYH